MVTFLWNIVLVATLVGGTVSVRRIALGMRFWRNDTLHGAARRPRALRTVPVTAGPCVRSRLVAL